MINGIQLKVCGLTTLRDAEFAEGVGADYLGFNFYPGSPRALALKDYLAFAKRVSRPGKVAVVVEPTNKDLAELKAAGFEFFQVHFRHDLPIATVERWSKAIGAKHLWLAPKLPPSVELPAALLPLAETFLVDTFDSKKFGGTGRTGDWAKFARMQAKYPEATWVLSGGLNAANIADAVGRSGARFVDVSSGVESSPGVKDHKKIRALVSALKGRTGL